MRLLAAVLGLVAVSAAAEMPPHLKRLPAGVLERGQPPVALGAAREGARVPLWLPGGERSFEVERVVEAGASTTRFGRVAGVGHGAITLGPDGGFGRVTQGATVWLLEYRGGEAFAVRAGEGGLALADYDPGAREAPGAAPAKAAVVPAKAAAAREVDFVGLYDADFAVRYPGALAATRIAHFVALANQAFVDSDVAITLRTVLTQPAIGPVSPSALDNIDALFDAQQVGGNFAGVDVLALRALTGADLVSFFRVQDLYAREVCGVAYFPADFRTGINVVMDGESGGSLCDDYTFAHEVGHNLGARHQLTADATPALGHAFVRPGQFTTIMASLGTGKPDRRRQLGYYSNPRIACGNLPCGAAGIEDNAGAMNANAELVAGYSRVRAAGPVAVRPAPSLADSDGDGVIDRIDAFPFDAARSVDTDGDGHADADDAFPDNSDEWADTDGSGLGDNADTDDDNDGVPDASDAFPLDPAESADADGDGWGDNSDQYDSDPYEQRDTDAGGLGDRADGNDDNDGIVDLAPLNAAADGELLVADGADDRILRFRGSDFFPLGVLVQLGADEVTFRTGIASAPSGEVYFVAGSQLRMVDRLRSATPELMLDPASHPLVGTGFPLAPVVLGTGDVLVAEMGNGGLLLTMRPAPSHAATPLIRRFTITGLNAAPYAVRENSGDVLVLDGAIGSLRRYAYGADPVAAGPSLLASFPAAVPPLSSGGIAQGPGGLLYWVDRRDGAVRSLDVNTGADGGFSVANADAAAITVSPDGILFVAQRSGGVQAYDAGSGADLGLVIPAFNAAQPLALAFVRRIVDTSLPPYLPPAPPAPSADPGTTPATGGTAPPPPPCTTDCIQVVGGGGGGGAFGGVLALLLALLARIVAAYTSATRANTSRIRSSR
jgi:hypothetical protein